MNDFQFGATMIFIVLVGGSLIFLVADNRNAEFQQEIERRIANEKLLDEGYFLLTTQDGMTNFNTELGCGLRETYLEKYQHDWTNDTMKHIAYDKWINECLTKEIEK